MIQSRIGRQFHMTIIVLMFQPNKSGIENYLGSRVGVKQNKSSAADDGDAACIIPIRN